MATCKHTYTLWFLSLHCLPGGLSPKDHLAFQNSCAVKQKFWGTFSTARNSVRSMSRKPEQFLYILSLLQPPSLHWEERQGLTPSLGTAPGISELCIGLLVRRPWPKGQRTIESTLWVLLQKFGCYGSLQVQCWLP